MSVDQELETGLEEIARSLSIDVDEALAQARGRGRRRRHGRRLAVGGALVVLASAIGVAAVLAPVDEPTEQRLVSEGTDEPPTHREIGHQLELELPTGWAVAPARLTDEPVDPAEILSFGTGPLVFGGEETCDLPSTPNAAIEAMAADDILVQLVERRGDPLASGTVGPWPVAFGAGTLRPWNSEVECFDAPASYTWNVFAAEGREIYLLAAVGDAVSPEREAELWQVLESLAFEPRQTTRDIVVGAAVPADLELTDQFVRSDAAIEAFPFDAYPWFEIRQWEQDFDRWLRLVVANPNEFAPELDAGEVTGGPLSPQFPDGTEFRWTTAENGVVVLVSARGLTAEELDEYVFSLSVIQAGSSDATVTTTTPPTYPSACSDPTPSPWLHPLEGEGDGLPPLQGTDLETVLTTYAGRVVRPGTGDERISSEVVPRNGMVWARDDDGRLNREVGEVVTITVEDFWLRETVRTPESFPGYVFYNGAPAQYYACWPE